MFAEPPCGKPLALEPPKELNVLRGYNGILENKMETTTTGYIGYIGIILGYNGIMENEMETTNLGLRDLGFRDPPHPVVVV